MKPTAIAKNIYDVGVVDWNIRNFHGYSTEKGTSYNAFLILDEKTTLIDTVKSTFSNELIKNISEIIDPKQIDIIISNHTEMDHSGSLPHIMHLIGSNKPLYCSKMGYKNLSKHFDNKWNYQVVKDGEQLGIGKHTLTFLEAKMLHWPDSMFTYLNENQILFSSDGFGQHYASFERFEESSPEKVMHQAKKYFANILLPYSPRIIKTINKIINMNLKIDMICPDHGLIWRKNPQKIIEQYIKWSKQKSKNQAVVIYDSMWNSTKLMAESIAKGLNSADLKTNPINIRKTNRSDIMTDILEAGIIVIGSPTLNNQMFPTVSDLLTYIKGLKPKNKIAAAFGSYGWSGEAVKHITAELNSIGFHLLDDGLSIQYIPNKSNLIDCFNYGKKIASFFKKSCL